MVWSLGRIMGIWGWGASNRREVAKSRGKCREMPKLLSQAVPVGGDGLGNVSGGGRWSMKTADQLLSCIAG